MKREIKVIAAWMILAIPFRATSGADDAAEPDEMYGGGKPPRAEAVFTEHAPVIDGVWSGKEWDAAKPVFFPAPKAGEDSTAKPPCEVRFLWTSEGLYVGFRTTDTTPAFGHEKPGEPLYQEDAFELFIDQTGDHRQFYEIQMDPAGQVYFRNNLLTAPPRITKTKRLTPEFCEKELWRYDVPQPEGFQIASKLDPQTHVWTLEAFFPAAFVNKRRGGPMQPCTWRINMARHDWDSPKTDPVDPAAPKRKVQFMYWSTVLPGHPHLSPFAMGWLEFVKP